MTEKKTQAAIGEALRLLRGDRSTAEVAEAIGISEPSLLAYEGDERAPGDGVKARIAKFYGTPVETIFKVNDEEGENTMKRSITKAIEEGHQMIEENGSLDLSVEEIERIISMANQEAEKSQGKTCKGDAILEAIGLAFEAGIAVGRRYEKKFDSESVIHEMEDRLIYPLEYLQEAMTHAAAEAVGKYEFESNADAFGLACLLRVFADQLKAISDNSDKVIATVTEIVKNAGAVD